MHFFTRFPRKSTTISRQYFTQFIRHQRRFHTTPLMAAANTTAALYAAVISSSQLTGGVPEDATEKRHHLQGGKGFTNPWESYRDFSGPKIGLQMIGRILTGKANKPDTTPPTVPVHAPEFLPSRETGTLRATWLGHACYYIEFPSGLRVLFDPVFERRCSPFTWLGPARYTEMPCKIEDLPFIDAVVISHNHYDHLSHPTVTKIKELHPNVHFFVPLGNKQWFTKSELHNVTELDWWESRDMKLTATPPRDTPDGAPKIVDSGSSRSSSIQDIVATIGCLPCQHTSARTPFDKSQTLWASWSISSGGKSVWFGGDTGYRAVPQLPAGENDYDTKYDFPHCPAFAQIGKLRGPFDLGLIPIGAYDPRFVMSPMHANPFDSVNIFLDTKCKRAMGIHWGTWVLTEEDVLEPPQLLKEAMKWKALPEEGVFDVCNIGESREF